MRTMLRVLAITSATTVAVWAPAHAPAQPRLIVEDAHHDFGTLAPGVAAVHRFQVRNDGAAPLHISQVRASCGCTSTVIGASVLAPGATTEIEVTFHTAGVVGHAQKTVEVMSDDPVSPSLLLTFEAEVSAAAVLVDDHVQFEDLTPDVRRQMSVRIQSSTRQPILVTQVDLSPAPWLGVSTHPQENDVWVDLDLQARSLPPGKLSGTDEVTLHVANPRPSTLHLSVRWAKRPPVTALPSQLAWAEAAGRSLGAKVALTQAEGKPFRVLSARTSSPLLQVSGLSSTAAARQTFRVTLSGDARPGQHTEKVFLVLDTPGHPEFEFRVSAALH